MRFTTLLSLLLIFPITVFSQTTAGGQINVYSSLTGQDACANSISVSNPDVFEPGMRIVIITMQGAAIQTGNNASFGTIADLNGTGQYELNTILEIQQENLVLTHTLQHDYPANGTQVVGAPAYNAVVVTESVIPQPWNGTTGGVILLHATESITLQANVDASGAGFRGGMPEVVADNNCTWLINQNDYSYASGNWRAAPKGEGIVVLPSSMANGRGAAANGGGGGNDHNSGGGGGALATSGGVGGRNEEPTTFGCNGDNPGIGGRALPTNALLFMGGGGGSGHANNTAGPAGGGNGGGIVLLSAPSIFFDGGSLIANGANGGTAVGDGGGGGGAGGSIVLLADTVEGTPSIRANGGLGGGVNNQNAPRCFGPGGGGSGGVFLSNQLLTASLSGGTPGISAQSSECSDSSRGATAGQDGTTVSLTELPQGDEFITPAVSSILPESGIVEGCLGSQATIAVTLNTNAEPVGFTYQWQTQTSSGTWVNLSGATAALYTFTITTEQSFRLIINPLGDCFAPIISPEFHVSLTQPTIVEATHTVVGSTATFQSTVEGWYNELSWDFGDGTTSTDPNPVHIYTAPGTYEAVLTLLTSCGEVQAVTTVVIAPPFAVALQASITEGCSPLSVFFQDVSTGTILTRNWTFEGGNPASGNEMEAWVVFDTPAHTPSHWRYPTGLLPKLPTKPWSFQHRLFLHSALKATS
ncbi:MAG: PKD domain-containing protein [Saprospiraceae bacterium]